MSDHKSWTQLDRYAHGLLESDERRVIEAHAHECAECTAALRSLRREEDALRRAIAPEDADEEAVEEIVRVARGHRLPGTPTPRRIARLIPLVAAGALIVVIVVATRFHPQRAAEDPVTAALAALSRQEPDAEVRVTRLGRKGLPELRRAEASAVGEARMRLASARELVGRALPRVLWVEADPRNDFVMLAPALREDRGWLAQTLVLETKVCETSTWTIDVPFRAPLRSFPTHELVDYDVIILGSFRSTDAALPAAIDGFVRVYGGSLLMIAGERGDEIQDVCAALAPVEPVLKAHPAASQVRLTEAGRRHDALGVATKESREEFFEGVKPIRWYRTVRAKSGASVLLETREGAPLLTVAEVGRGRVAYVATDDHWIWGAEQQVSYYKAILRWLAHQTP